MGLEIHEEPKKDRIITMGQADKPVEPVADYYPPGATEPIVRPAHIPAPEPKPEPVKEPEVKEEVKEELKEEVKAEAKAEVAETKPKKIQSK